MTPEKLREAAERVKHILPATAKYECADVAEVRADRDALAIAADACTTLAAQMESAEQDSRELFNTWHNDMNRTRYGHPEREAWDAAWRAAQAAMQAKLDAAIQPSSVPCCNCGGVVYEFTVHNYDWNKLIRGDSPETDQEYLCVWCFAKKARERLDAANLEACNAESELFKARLLCDALIKERDAANERVKELEASAQRDGMHFMPSTLKMGIHPDTIEELHLHDELCCDLVAMRMDRLIQDTKAALATAERERELLRKEVRRCWELADKELGPPSDFCVYCDAQREDRPAEVRALVDDAGPSGATR